MWVFHVQTPIPFWTFAQPIDKFWHIGLPPLNSWRVFQQGAIGLHLRGCQAGVSATIGLTIHQQQQPFADPDCGCFSATAHLCTSQTPSPPTEEYQFAKSPWPVIATRYLPRPTALRVDPQKEKAGPGKEYGAVNRRPLSGQRQGLSWLCDRQEQRRHANRFNDRQQIHNSIDDSHVSRPPRGRISTMHLSPLQSRLAASLVASCLLILLYLVLFPPNFALAAELNEALPVIFDGLDSAADLAEPGPLGPTTYEAEFSAFDRSIIGRATRDLITLTNDEPLPMNVDQGVTQPFVFLLPRVSDRGAVGDRLELRRERSVSGDGHAGAGAGAVENEEGGEQQGQDIEKRQAARMVYISANTCLQPQPVDPSKTTEDPPQLKLYVSTSPDNTAPGPLADPETQHVKNFTQGAVTYNITTNREVYIGIHAPESERFSGTYNLRLAASTDSYYYTYDTKDPDLIFVDSDSQGALLMTPDLVDSRDPEEEDAIMEAPPYVLFAHNVKDRAVNGLKYSYCGLYNYAKIAATKDERQTGTVSTSMTKRGDGRPKQQFFFSELNSSATYIGILAVDGADGGKLGKRQTAFERGPLVFKEMNFTTKSGRHLTQ